MKAVRILITGKPCTKKTSQVIATNRKTGKPFIIGHKRSTGYAAEVQKQAREQYDGEPLTGPIVVSYHVYRAADRGDLGGFEAAIDDALQGVVYENDAQIVCRSSAKHIDRVNPRVEILVTGVAA